MTSLVILGHDICVKLLHGKYVMRDELGNEVYEISHAIMQGDYYGDIFIKSLKVKASWNIVN